MVFETVSQILTINIILKKGLLKLGRIVYNRKVKLGISSLHTRISKEAHRKEPVPPQKGKGCGVDG